MQGSTIENPSQVLFDPGLDETFLYVRCLPPPGINSAVTTKKNGKTTSGQFVSTRQVTLQDITIPESSKHHLDEHQCQIFDAHYFYHNH
jgi:hypothetical protein